MMGLVFTDVTAHTTDFEGIMGDLTTHIVSITHESFQQHGHMVASVGHEFETSNHNGRYSLINS